MQCNSARKYMTTHWCQKITNTVPNLYKAYAFIHPVGGFVATLPSMLWWQRRRAVCLRQLSFLLTVISTLDPVSSSWTHNIDKIFRPINKIILMRASSRGLPAIVRFTADSPLRYCLHIWSHHVSFPDLYCFGISLSNSPSSLDRLVNSMPHSSMTMTTVSEVMVLVCFFF